MHTFTTTEGRVVHIRPINITLLGLAKAALEKQMQERGELPALPTYTVTGLGGIKSEMPHDETTLEVADPEQTAANKAAWKAYQDSRAKLEAAWTRKQGELILLEGVAEQAENDEWAARQLRRFGVTAPDDQEARHFHWLTTELLKTQNDLAQAVCAIMLLTGKGEVSEEDLRAAIDTFRLSLQGDAPAGKVPGTPEVEMEGGQQQTPGTPDGEPVGGTAKRVSRAKRH
jgi:hypothetical protein